MADVKHEIKFREVNRDIFEAIKKGEKKVETRAATEKHLKIKAGDMLSGIFSISFCKK